MLLSFSSTKQKGQLRIYDGRGARTTKKNSDESNESAHLNYCQLLRDIQQPADKCDDWKDWNPTPVTR